MSGAREMMGVLDSIVAGKREGLASLWRRSRELRLAAEAADAARDFAGSLRQPGEVSLIAEVKRRSPSSGWLREGADAAELAGWYASAGAAAVSVLTEEEHFGGETVDVERVRGRVELPVLRKDFVVDPVQLWESRAIGADGVLLIVRVLDDALLRDLLSLLAELGMSALVEIHDGRELDRAVAGGARVIGINNRDLETFGTDQRVALELAPELPEEEFVVVAESGIGTSSDVDRLGAAGVDAVLVGESLVRAEDVAAAARSLTGRPRYPRGAA